MDAPNAPNPANLNVQDQFVDAVQSPANQAQGPAQVGQNVPMQPPQQPAPAQPSLAGPVVPAQPAPIQPVPIGPVAPAPQVFYQNWIGKPEEDVESHLLSTRDWMEAHNFPNEVKVRHFCLTLIGEVRLWYKSLALLDDDWPALLNKFRWQYSKLGNTPEQLFHAWRTF